jgi:phage terminase small subunit
MQKRTLNEKKVIKKSDEVVSREIEGKVVLMPLHKTSKDLNYIYTLNETASLAWGLFDGKSTTGDIRKSISEAYDVAQDKVEKELCEFVKDLKAIKAIV